MLRQRLRRRLHPTRGHPSRGSRDLGRRGLNPDLEGGSPLRDASTYSNTGAYRYTDFCPHIDPIPNAGTNIYTNTDPNAHVGPHPNSTS